MKRIYVNIEKCTGCNICRLVCSQQLVNGVNSKISLLKVVKERVYDNYKPIVCRQCNDAPCANVCPVNAIQRDPKTGVLKIINEECIGCMACLEACPFGVIIEKEDSPSPFKCDHCDGAPLCVKYCPTEALLFEDGIETSERLSISDKRGDL